MLGDAGSRASLVGVVVSLGGLSFAIWQLTQLRGETRAAREAAEATRRAIGRDLAIADISRTYERIQTLKRLLRQGSRGEALYLYPEVRKGLIDIRTRYPDLPKTDIEAINNGIERLRFMEQLIESETPDLSPTVISDFNAYLTDIDAMLADIGSRLQ